MTNMDVQHPNRNGVFKKISKFMETHIVLGYILIFFAMPVSIVSAILAITTLVMLPIGYLLGCV